MSKTFIIAGEYQWNPQFEKDKKYIPEGLYPRRYWDIVEVEDEEGLIEYLNGQRPFTSEPEPEEQDEPEPLMHKCATCKRMCKAQYKTCYRCHQFNIKKQRIMRGIA